MKRLGTAVFAAALAVGGAAWAEYPEQDITYIIPFGPGGESDITARMQQEAFPKHANGKRLVIVYKPGAGGAQAWASLNQLPADGYTVMGSNIPHIILQPLLKEAAYQTDDIGTVHFFHYTPDAIIVREASQFKTLQELIDYAKQNPGMVTFAGSGTNSANHLLQMKFDQMAGTTTTYIPFKGTGAAVTALLGGQVTGGAGYSTIAINYPGSRALAVAAEERLPSMPDVPTFKELGFDWTGGAYRGIAMPKDTPEEIKQQFSALIEQINQDPAFVKKMEDGGFVVTHITHDKMPEFMAEQKEIYQGIARDMGLITGPEAAEAR